MENKMQTPFPIRGTEAWDRREHSRFLDGKLIMSFGPIQKESETRRFQQVRDATRNGLRKYGVDEDVINRFVGVRWGNNA